VRWRKLHHNYPIAKTLQGKKEQGQNVSDYKDNIINKPDEFFGKIHYGETCLLADVLARWNIR
jgi:hypothetical protein